uniref:Candidate secreted effector n=1 Tax=Meloidogyne incognita TaxID=6306 RepID=A0A914KNL9_MELIC
MRTTTNKLMCVSRRRAVLSFSFSPSFLPSFCPLSSAPPSIERRRHCRPCSTATTTPNKNNSFLSPSCC